MQPFETYRAQHVGRKVFAFHNRETFAALHHLPVSLLLGLAFDSFFLRLVLVG